MDDAAATVMRWAAANDGKCRYVCVSGVHGVVEAQSDAALRAILSDAHLNVPDGMPLSWIGWFAGFKGMDRVFGPDLMVRILAISGPEGPSHFFYGGGEGIADALATRFKAMYSGLKVAGTYCPPFRLLSEAEKQGVIERINASGAQIVWVGLSTPKQEKWMSEMVPHLKAKVALGVGAAFDYNTGGLHRAPRWMQRAGLEWLYRVVQEPFRLAKRYAVVIPRFIVGILRQALGKQK